LGGGVGKQLERCLAVSLNTNAIAKCKGESELSLGVILIGRRSEVSDGCNVVHGNGIAGFQAPSEPYLRPGMPSICGCATVSDREGKISWH
jgi:hypothetical protein